jgi:hypothetical protein
MRRVIAALCVAGLLVAVTAPIAVAAPGKANTIRGIIDMETDFGAPAPDCPGVSEQPLGPDAAGCWYGTVTGDITGTIAFWEDPPGVVIGKPGYEKREQFTEKFTLRTGGGWIVGYDNGVYDFVTGKFHASGFVTDASPDLSGFIGRRFFESGTTTDTSGYPIFSHVTAFSMAKAQGEPWP